MSALDTQIQGTHYKNVKIQPIEIAYMLGASPAWCKLAKYLSRDKGDKKINLQKAIHCIQLEKELAVKYDPYEHSSEYALLYSHKGVWVKTVRDFSSQFTESEDFFDALYCMYRNDYDCAINAVKNYALELGIDL